MAQRPLTFPESEVAAAVAFLRHVEARLASDPAVHNELRRILGSFFRRSFCKGEKPDHHKVKADLYALLWGHPDLIDGLDAIIKTEPAREDPARSRRPRRERRPTSAAAADDRAHIHRALRYLERVSARRPGLHDRLLALLFHLGSGQEDGNEIYDRALDVFGSKDGDLLREFTEYLPIPTESERDLFLRRLAKKEPPHAEHRALAPKRKATAAVTVNNPIAAKRPRADERKTANRRANSPAVVDAAPKSGGVLEFREAWEFETTYTKLVATARRTKELLEQYERPKDAPPPRGRRLFEELFPSRECQEVLREMYNGMLGHIQEALEDGARTELALRTIKRRLGMLEQAAVKMAMERRDRARVEGRMQKLAGDRVLVLRKEQARLAERRHVVVRGDPNVHSVKHTEVDQQTLVHC